MTRIDDNYLVLAPGGRHFADIMALNLPDYVQWRQNSRPRDRHIWPDTLPSAIC